MRKFILPIFFVVCSINHLKAAQTFTFSFNNIPDSYSGNSYVYNLKTVITVVGIKIDQIYYDNGTNAGSFAYSLLVNYSNTLTGTMPSGMASLNFSDYDITVNSNTGQAAMSQNFLSSVLFKTANGGPLSLSGNTYNGSASSFGYVSGTTYSDAATLTRFGFNSMTFYETPPSSTTGRQTQSSSVILPITLTSFTAVPNGDNVSLSWTTASETNSSFFSVERSSSSIFQEIKKIVAKGNSITTVNYNINDNAPLQGISYYRLKEIDLDGNFYYSNIVSVNNSSSIAKISFYPTVSTSNTIHFTGNTSNEIINIFSTSGAKIFTTTLNGSSITLPTLAKGVYYIKISSADGSNQIGKFIKE